jgi:hypothetical protein
MGRRERDRNGHGAARLEATGVDDDAPPPACQCEGFDRGDSGNAPEALSRLLEHEALWFSSWCFARNETDLGLLAYEVFLASKSELGDGPAQTSLCVGRGLAVAQATTCQAMTSIATHAPT